MAWRKRGYEKSFISKISDLESEAAETQVWLAFAVRCGYIQRDEANDLYRTYNEIIRTLVGMINHPETWVVGLQDKTIREAQEPYGDMFE